MPSFDIVSVVDLQELRNAVDQSNRELGTRFDFKGSDTRVEQSEYQLKLTAQNEFQLQQAVEILLGRLSKRGIDIACLERGEVETHAREARQEIRVRHGIETELARKIVRLVKDSKLKVQAAIQSDQVRVTGKQRDDLQAVMQVLRGADLGFPVQYVNFRD
ncbi:MAG: YajQ family cyclic di-GMP-binding protein [Gammaproteobacteria bacterium]